MDPIGFLEKDWAALGEGPWAFVRCVVIVVGLAWLGAGIYFGQLHEPAHVCLQQGLQCPNIAAAVPAQKPISVRTADLPKDPAIQQMQTKRTEQHTEIKRTPVNQPAPTAMSETSQCPPGYTQIQRIGIDGAPGGMTIPASPPVCLDDIQERKLAGFGFTVRLPSQ